MFMKPLKVSTRTDGFCLVIFISEQIQKSFLNSNAYESDPMNVLPKTSPKTTNTSRDSVTQVPEHPRRFTVPFDKPLIA